MTDFNLQRESTFSYNALNEDEIARLTKRIQPGEYDFTCVDAIFGFSKDKMKDGQLVAGQPMLTLKLKVFDNDIEYIVNDWIVLTDKMIFKIKHFFETVGYPRLYKGQNTASDFIEKSGRIRIGERKSEYKGIESMMIYVKDYVKPEKIIDNEISYNMNKSPSPLFETDTFEIDNDFTV